MSKKSIKIVLYTGACVALLILLISGAVAIEVRRNIKLDQRIESAVRQAAPVGTDLYVLQEFAKNNNYSFYTYTTDTASDSYTSMVIEPRGHSESLLLDALRTAGYAADIEGDFLGPVPRVVVKLRNNKVVSYIE